MHKIHRILRPKMGLIVRKNVLLVSLVLSFLCILPVSALLKSQGSISASPEPQFTDASSHGLSIVPASGNSNPLPLPWGYVDSHSCESGGVEGWADDPVISSASIEVRIFIDGGFVEKILANTSRPDVNAALGITGNHGFVWTIPDTYQDDSPHTLIAYAITSDGRTGQLNTSDQSGIVHFNCNKPILDMSITAEKAAVHVGEQDKIHAQFNPTGGDSLIGSSINEIPPSTVNGGQEFIDIETGKMYNAQGTLFVHTSYAVNPLEYTFVPTVPGTYIFLPYGESDAHHLEPNTIDSSRWATVVVTDDGSHLCPDGSAAPNGDPNQCTCAHGNTSACSHKCPDGTSAPDDNPAECTCFQGNVAVCNRCPDGSLAPHNDPNQCVHQCTSVPGDYCDPSDGNIYHQDSTCHKSFQRQCQYGCSTISEQCSVLSPIIIKQLSAHPSLVRSGDTSVLSWAVQYVRSCSVSGTDGEAWSCSGDSCADLSNNTKVTQSLTSQTIFTLSCIPYSGALNGDGSPYIWADEHATVTIAPTNHEP